MRLLPIAILCALGASAAAYPDFSPLKREIRAHMRELRGCYERALQKNPKLEGRVVATFLIGPGGKVVESTASGLPGVDACVASVISRIKFTAPPKSKGTIRVSYPFVFQPR
ncbi:MAG: AgmX/PglI C-terminal domain-containing protein [Polyangiales bacterium]